MGAVTRPRSGSDGANPPKGVISNSQSALLEPFSPPHFDKRSFSLSSHARRSDSLSPAPPR